MTQRNTYLELLFSFGLVAFVINLFIPCIVHIAHHYSVPATVVLKLFTMAYLTKFLVVCFLPFMIRLLSPLMLILLGWLVAFSGASICLVSVEFRWFQTGFLMISAGSGISLLLPAALLQKYFNAEELKEYAFWLIATPLVAGPIAYCYGALSVSLGYWKATLMGLQLIILVASAYFIYVQLMFDFKHKFSFALAQIRNISLLMRNQKHYFLINFMTYAYFSAWVISASYHLLSVDHWSSIHYALTLTVTNGFPPVVAIIVNRMFLKHYNPSGVLYIILALRIVLAGVLLVGIVTSSFTLAWQLLGFSLGLTTITLSRAQIMRITSQDDQEMLFLSNFIQTITVLLGCILGSHLSATYHGATFSHIPVIMILTGILSIGLIYKTPNFN